MKKIMILGAGRGQVPIINLAKSCGMETIVVSIPGDYPGLKIADKVCEVDIRDKEKVLEAAREEHVDGIIADQIDIAVPTAAYVTEKLGLPSNGYDCALKFTNKFLMRNECQKLNVRTPVYYEATTLDDAREKCLEIGLPVVIKPTDSAGSKGVSLIRNIEEIEQKYHNAIRYSVEKRVIVEKYIQGKEYMVDGFACNYRFMNLSIAERKYFEIPDLFIPKQSIYGPYKGDSIKEQILDINRKIVEGFGLKFGITHSEYLVEEETGNIYLGEIAARGGGTYISSDLIPLITGTDFNRLLLDIVVGNNDEIHITDIENNVAGYVCFTLPQGIVRDIRGVESVRKLPGVHKVILDSLYPGMETKDMSDKSSRMGPILIQGNSAEQCEDTINSIMNLLEIDVETSEGIKGIIW